MNEVVVWTFIDQSAVFEHDDFIGPGEDTGAMRYDQLRIRGASSVDRFDELVLSGVIHRAHYVVEQYDLKVSIKESCNG